MYIILRIIFALKEVRERMDPPLYMGGKSMKNYKGGKLLKTLGKD